MDPAVKGLLNLGIDVSLADQAAKGSLNMGAGAAETVVEIEVAESRIQVVAPKEANHPAAKPDTFRITGWAGQNTGGLCYFVDLFLVSLAASAAGFCGSGGFPLLPPLCAKAGAVNPKAATQDSTVKN